MLTDKLLVITTTKPNDVTSAKRITNLINNFSKYNLPLIINEYTSKKLPIHQISYEMIVNNIQLFLRTNYEYALIIDNDFSPIPNFMTELNKTVSLLPDNWRSLHLAVGYLWGRKFRNPAKISHLNPEGKIDDLLYHESGRFFNRCNSATYYKKGCWLGGSIAILIKRDDRLLTDFMNQYKLTPVNNDVILTSILNSDDYICREPILGYEDEQGGTTF